MSSSPCASHIYREGELAAPATKAAAPPRKLLISRGSRRAHRAASSCGRGGAQMTNWRTRINVPPHGEVLVMRDDTFETGFRGVFERRETRSGNKYETVVYNSRTDRNQVIGNFPTTHLAALAYSWHMGLEAQPRSSAPSSSAAVSIDLAAEEETQQQQQQEQQPQQQPQQQQQQQQQQVAGGDNVWGVALAAAAAAPQEAEEDQWGHHWDNENWIPSDEEGEARPLGPGRGWPRSQRTPRGRDARY